MSFFDYKFLAKNDCKKWSKYFFETHSFRDFFRAIFISFNEIKYLIENKWTNIIFCDKPDLGAI